MVDFHIAVGLLWIEMPTRSNDHLKLSDHITVRVCVCVFVCVVCVWYVCVYVSVCPVKLIFVNPVRTKI